MTSFNEKFSDIDDYHDEYDRYIDDEISQEEVSLGNSFDDYRTVNDEENGREDYIANNEIAERQRWLDYCELNHIHYDEGDYDDGGEG